MTSDPVNWVDPDGLKASGIANQTLRIRFSGNYSAFADLPTSLETLAFQNSYTSHPNIFNILKKIEAYKQTSYDVETFYYRITWEQAIGSEYRYNYNFEISYDQPITTGYALPYKPEYYKTFKYLDGSFKGNLRFPTGCER